MATAYTVKIQFRDDLRRIGFETRPTISELRNLIARLFISRSLHPQFVIQYVDDEGDHITIESDFELGFALPRGATVRLVLSEPKTSTPAPAPPPAVAPTPVIPPSQPTPAPACPFDQSFAPLLNTFMRSFSQPQQPVDLSSILNMAFTALGGMMAPPAQPSAPATPAAPAPPTHFSCPFEFFQGLLENLLEENEECHKFATEHVRCFIKAQTKAANYVLPSLAELPNLAIDFLINFINDPEVQEECSWIKYFKEEHVRGIVTAVSASPVIQDLVYTAYASVEESVERRKEREAREAERRAPPPPPVEVYTAEEQELLAQLAGMGFVDRKLCIRHLRENEHDIWATVDALISSS